MILDVNTGIVTLLFTDIEGSTEKWEQEPERMALALAQHDELLRSAVETHRGRVVKTTGDGIYAAFADATNCVDAAIAIQQSIADPAQMAGMQLFVRCGLHAGPALERDNDFFGNTANRAARIMGLAYGGQVLLSQAVADRVIGKLSTETSLRDLGDVRLKGIADAERVYQVEHPTLRREFPALRSLATTPNNLPHQLTSFVGREREIAETGALLGRTRLLTLLGMGGLGKTRLSLQIAGELLDTYRDGAWFVDLAPIREPSLVASETAKVLGVREEPGNPILRTLCAHLTRRRLLLILDNCEHLLEPSAELASSILGSTRDVRMIATSRAVLRVPGEQAYSVPPLPVPGRHDGLDALSRSTAVRLFVERAQLHKPTFALDERDAPAVAELVARLEGIPLALELAAARVRAMSVADINGRLNDRFRLLTGGSRTLLPRQQTLRALVDWSYDLLDLRERTVLNRLSAFVGGFDLAAAEQVCGADPLKPPDVLDIVTALVDKSLIVADECEHGTRYRLLETLRDYAREKLEQSDDFALTIARHCLHYFAFAKAVQAGMVGPEQPLWIERMEMDLDNVRSGIATALAGGVEPFVAVKYAVAMMTFWSMRGYATEGRNIVHAALKLPAVQASELAQGHALYVGAALAGSQSDDREAERMLEICLALRQSLGNPFDTAATLSTLSVARLRLGDTARAREGEVGALAIFRQLGCRIEESVVLLHLGEICAHTGEADEARRFLEQSLSIARELEYQETVADAERALALLTLDEGDLAGARDRLDRVLGVCQAAGDRRGVATTLWLLGEVDLATGDAASAQQRLGEALRCFQLFQMGTEATGCLEDHAYLARANGLAEEAVRLHAAAAKWRTRTGVVRRPRAESHWQRELGTLRDVLGNTAFDAAWAGGQRWDDDEAIRLALNFMPAPAIP